MDYTFPFHVPANGVVHKQGLPAIVKGRLSLHVVTGGPVFLFGGRKSAAEANAILTDATILHPEFELAAVPAQPAETYVSSAGLEFSTVYSTAESIGYLQLVEEEAADNPFVDLVKAIETLRRDGIRLNHDIPHGPIPTDPGAPRLAPMRGHMIS